MTINKPTWFSWLLAGVLVFSPRLHGQVVVITREAAIEAVDVHLGADGSLDVTGGKGQQATRQLRTDQVIAVLFDVLPSDAPARAWLCLRDGQRLSGPSLAITGDAVSLAQPGSGKAALTSPLAETAAVFFRAVRPNITSQPAEGVQIVSTNGDVLNAPALEWSDTGLLVEVNPNVDPITLPRDRIAAIVWSAAETSQTPSPTTSTSPETSRPATGNTVPPLVELRTGERVAGRIEAIDSQTVRLHGPAGTSSAARRDVQAIWFTRPQMASVEELASVPSTEGRPPSVRRGHNAIGAPLRIGSRLYRSGLGMKGPTTVEIPVPAGATWLVGWIGADADAAHSVRLSLAVALDGKPCVEYKDLTPGEQARRLVVPVGGGKKVSLSIRPAGADSTGCLGDFADAFFMH